MLFLWACLLLIVTLYLVVVNKSEDPDNYCLVSAVGGVGWQWWGGLHSNFPVQPNCSVEVVLGLCCVVVAVLSIIFVSMT